MKKIVIIISMILCSWASIHAWTWKVDQYHNFEQDTHETLHELGRVFERSTNNLAHAINQITEQGISSLPLNINQDVWQNIRHILLSIAFLSLGWLITFWGLLGLRKRLIFAHSYESWQRFALSISATILCVLLGIIGMCFSNFFAHLIIFGI